MFDHSFILTLLQVNLLNKGNPTPFGLTSLLFAAGKSIKRALPGDVTAKNDTVKKYL
jgi:hypothetical protein